MCGRSDRWIKGGGGITSMIDSEPIRFWSGDGEVDRLVRQESLWMMMF